jgi:WD40 repeat protein
MNPSTLARSLPASAARRWRALRLRTRVLLGSLVVALTVLFGFFLRIQPDEWPARTVIDVPERNWPLAFSPDGRTFLTTGEAGIIPWDTGTGRKGIPWTTKDGLFVKTRQGWLIRKGAYSSDGRTFAATISQSAQLAAFELIDTSTGQTKATLTTQHPLVFDMAFADDGRNLRAVLGDSRMPKEVVTWDVATGQRTSSRPITAPFRASSTAFSPDGRMFAFIPNGATAVQLWDLETDATLGGLTNPARAGNLLGPGVEFSPDSRTLAIARSDGAVDLWNVPGRKLLKTLAVHPRGYASMAIRFAPDGRTLASSGVEVGSNSALAEIQDGIRRKLFGPARNVRSEMIVVDLANGRRVARTSSSYYPMYTPDGRTLMTRREDLKVKLHDLPDGKEDRR